MSIATPAGSTCGKAAISEFHSGGSLLASVTNYPGGCTAGSLSAQEKAIEFMFFDLSGCQSSDGVAPPPPPPSAP
jgi:hypothetical protein